MSTFKDNKIAVNGDSHDEPKEYDFEGEGESYVESRLREIAETRERVRRVNAEARFRGSAAEHAAGVHHAVCDYLKAIEVPVSKHLPDVWSREHVATITLPKPSKEEIAATHFKNRGRPNPKELGRRYADCVEFKDMGEFVWKLEGLEALLDLPSTLSVDVAATISLRHQGDQTVTYPVERPVPVDVSDTVYRRGNGALGELDLDIPLGEPETDARGRYSHLLDGDDK